MSLISFSPSVEVQLSVWHLQVLGFMFHYTLKDGNMNTEHSVLMQHFYFQMDSRTPTSCEHNDDKLQHLLKVFLFLSPHPSSPPDCLTATFVLAK